jgi:hypothetical protein
MKADFNTGDRVIYRKQKFSVCPGPQAKRVHPAPYGDFYSYEVDKFWTVIAVQPDHQIVVCTRRGKQLTLHADDPALRRANWLERFLFRHRFPVLRPPDPTLTHGEPSPEEARTKLGNCPPEARPN